MRIAICTRKTYRFYGGVRPCRAEIVETRRPSRICLVRLLRYKRGDALRVGWDRQGIATVELAGRRRREEAAVCCEIFNL